MAAPPSKNGAPPPGQTQGMAAPSFTTEYGHAGLFVHHKPSSFGMTSLRNYAGSDDLSVVLGDVSAGYKAGLPEGHVIRTDGTSSDYLQFVAEKLLNMAQGCIVVYFRAASTALLPILSDKGASDYTLIIQQVASSNVLIFTTDDGATLESLNATGEAVWDEWALVGCEWSAAGKKIYTQGTLRKESAAMVSGTGASAQQQHRIGRTHNTYGAMDWRSIMVFDRPLGAAEHRRLWQKIRYGG